VDVRQLSCQQRTARVFGDLNMIKVKVWYARYPSGSDVNDKGAVDIGRSDQLAID